MKLSPTQRFSRRVDNYIRYRPSYPHAVIDLLRSECGLSPAASVADIGSGTGKLTELLLPHAGKVFAVEPNQDMRAVGEKLLQAQSNFVSVPGTAEATTLADQAVDLVVAAQAFHWFDLAAARKEFRRVLKPGGFVALLWNDRRLTATPFLTAYEVLLRGLGTDYEQVNHRNVDLKVITGFFEREPAQRTFPYAQDFDYEGLKGRLLSSSYAPAEGDAGCAAMLSQLRLIFDTHQVDGRVSLEYETVGYYGRLT